MVSFKKNISELKKIVRRKQIEKMKNIFFKA